MKRCKILSFILIVTAFVGCRSTSEEIKTTPLTLFQRLENSGVTFTNQLHYDEEFNIYTYRNFYNGGGVAIGDVNNDGLPDIYFTGNQVSNKLYLNKGNLQFEDITEAAGVGGTKAWSTGVSMADINGDGHLDLYVCNSGDVKGDNKQNELFINNGDLTFTEQAVEYGLDDRGFSTHAAFFDFDKDGDLDVYLLNNSYQAIGSFNLMQNERPVRDSVGGDKLYLNDGGRFVDISEQAGIYGSVIGFGLGVTVGDVNNDGWQDIFISNDFFEKDYLYVNNQDGTFSEVMEQSMPSISAASMGADMADFNNDGRPDIFVTDMLPEPLERVKQVTTFENWDKITYNVTNGYHYQYNRNMLHLNNGDGTFSEIGRFAGVAATDWSWGALFFDMDNDGQKDIFVANGIYQDITDLDYLNFISDEEVMKKIITDKGVDYKALIDPVPVNPVPNYTFKNEGNFTFSNMAETWGLATPVHSNGSAYGDLDNDGDLDLVVNNVNLESFLYENRSEEVYPERKHLKIKLLGSGKNTNAIGAKISVRLKDQNQYFEHMPIRGFQSSIDPVITIGLGEADQVDELQVKWPDNTITVLNSVKANQLLVLSQENGIPMTTTVANKTVNPIFKSSTLTPDHKHEENSFVDFDRDRLTYHMLSMEGPRLAIGDVNGDGDDDIYIGGAKGQSGKLFLYSKGSYLDSKNVIFELDASSEDTDAVFVDVDNDGDLDLIIAGGGNEFSVGSAELRDRLYFNDGKGNFSKVDNELFKKNRLITSSIVPADYDNDGLTDLFIGSRAMPFLYGVPANSFIYKNSGDGNFEDVTQKVAPELNKIGMVTDAIWTDIDEDNDLDLLVVGEWMAIEVFENNDGYFKKITEKYGLENYKGWWNTIKAADVDNDGDIDFIVGNHGTNSRFKASPESPLALYVNDFDKNGTAEHILCVTEGEKQIPYTLKHELVAQMPSLKKKYLKYKNYNDKSLTEIFTPEQLEKSVINSATHLSSAVLLNNNGKFKIIDLPPQAQFSPVYAITAEDFDNDGILDLLIGGNFRGAKPEAGKYDASYGLFLKGTGEGKFVPLGSGASGISVKGDIRDIQQVQVSGKKIIFIALNNDSIKAFTY